MRGKRRGGKGRDTGGGRAPLPLSHGAYGGEGTVTALRLGETEAVFRLDAEGGVARQVAGTIDGIVSLDVKVLCLL
jgi:hypothetical protein